MVAWLDRLTNLASSVRTEVCSPESSHEETTQLGSLGWDRGRGRSEVLDDAPSGGWVENKLTGTPDTDPCTQAPVSWRNADKPDIWICFDKHMALGNALLGNKKQLLLLCGSRLFCGSGGRTAVRKAVWQPSKTARCRSPIVCPRRAIDSY
jgi:hypothetical protein